MPIVYIKNMVCHRCKLAVDSIFRSAGLQPVKVELGEVHLEAMPDAKMLAGLNHQLQAIGFEIIDARRSRLIEQVKAIVIDAVQHSEEPGQQNLSQLLTQKLPYEYNYLSNLFSETEGQTIEKFYIAQRIEKVKELLMYDELSLPEIAFRLGYSSAAYLGNQFKKHTGLTPGFYKSMKANKRKPLDQL